MLPDAQIREYTPKRHSVSDYRNGRLHGISRTYDSDTGMERLGGLAKKLPVTAFAFFIGCLCISALVPFSGFAGEFLLYLSALTGLLAKAKAVSSACLLLLTGLALAGTVAAAAYVKAYSAVFLGAPRAKIEVHGPESRAIKIPLFILAALCVISALSAPLVLTYIVWPAVSSFTSAFAVPFALGLAKAQVTLVFSTVIATMERRRRFCPRLCAAA